MNIEEYDIVKNYDYKKYCDYLKNKYGKAKCSYFTKNFTKNSKITRTKEGLVCHHICEDRAIQLSLPEFAKKNPFDYQSPENLCYCDYLEHLFLHILICENPSLDKNVFEIVGIGGILNFIIPELNDIYGGWITKQNWRLYCHNKIKKDKDVYLILLKRFKDNCSNNILYTDGCLYTSFNEKFGLWSKEKNKNIFNEISKYLGEESLLEYITYFNSIIKSSNYKSLKELMLLLPKETKDSIKRKFFEIANQEDEQLSKELKIRSSFCKTAATERWIRLERTQKKVICIENNKVYDDCYDAQKQLKIRNVGNCCDGKQKLAGGYHWRYVEEDD